VGGWVGGGGGGGERAGFDDFLCLHDECGLDTG
jgi:hypothetical protein